jgi:hypothetical protein
MLLLNVKDLVTHLEDHKKKDKAKYLLLLKPVNYLFLLLFLLNVTPWVVILFSEEILVQSI